MEQVSFEEKLAKVDWLVEQARWAKMTLPKSGQCVCDDKTAVMDQEYFDQLGEYSCSLPSGTFIGKRWKRNQNEGPFWKCKSCGQTFAGFGFRQHCMTNDCQGELAHVELLPNWWMGEYYDLGTKDEVGIRWRKIQLV
jgi:hypothetical protein